MTSMTDKLKESHRLTRMRQGNEVPEDIQVPSNPEIHYWMVPITEAETQIGLITAANLDVPENIAGFSARNRAALQSDVFHSLREPGQVDKKAFESVDEMVELLDPTDIDAFAQRLEGLMEYASPSIDGLTDADLIDLKKAFGETDWSELTGQRWAVVKQCCQVLFPELLQVKLRGSFSTGSLTQTNESAESI